jgi:cytochrome c oxidase assembly protein subunit 15
MTGRLSNLRRRRLSPALFRRIALLAVWALGFIIVTGGAVRVTGSGLGCSNWPTCTTQSVVAPWQYHAMIEFGNRVVTGLVSAAVILAVLGSLVRSPRRRDLTWLSWGLVAGLVGQIVLGGEAVRHNLAPGFVMGHFLLSLVLLADALVLHHRAGLPETPVAAPRRSLGRPGSPWATVTGPPIPVVPPEQVVMGRLLMVAAALVLVLGTVVTSSGPHGGDPKAPRLQYSLHQVAQLHSLAVWLFLGLTVMSLVSMQRRGAPSRVMRQGEFLLITIISQGALGYLQYFSGVPAGLVALHIALATLVWAATVRFCLTFFERPAAMAEPTLTRDRLAAPSHDPMLAPG